MRKILQTLFVIATSCLLLSCASLNNEKDLARTFVELQDANKLPGLPPGADAEIHMQPIERPIDRFSHVAYPASRDIFVMPASTPDVYTYKFTKDSKKSDWHLARAWHTTQNGDRTELKLQP